MALLFLSPFALPANARERLAAVGHRLIKREPLRIVAFGSSSTQGVGASSPQRSYPAMLERNLSRMLPNQPVIVLNRGIGGEDARDMLKRLDSDALGQHPDLVIWQTGSNDPLRGVPLDQFKADTRIAVQKMKQAGIDVMLLEPQWCPALDKTPGAERFRDAVREIGTELDVPVIKRSSMMQAWVREQRISVKELLADDGLHMKDAGYALLADQVAHQIIDDAADEKRPAEHASLRITP